MDTLVAILMPGFKKSDWTNQEIGFAMGRGVLVIPVMRGLDPYGFIGKYQGLSANEKTVEEVAKEIFAIISTSDQTRIKIASLLIALLQRGATADYILEKASIIDSVPNFPISQLERLRDQAMSNNIIADNHHVLKKLNTLLESRGISKIVKYDDEFLQAPDDDIPF